MSDITRLGPTPPDAPDDPVTPPAAKSGETGDAYVRLLEDSLVGDPTLFTRSDAVDESWTYFDKILDYWKKHPETPLYGYPAGTWGPKEADVLINRSHSEWTNPCKNLTHSNLYCKL